ncbi:hypothetical protein Lmor_2325 [Legionella moravica]|uniref:Uncharacterized protein n=1 Tax=Legionella moravica TaxID=39962 RepID=A0A378JYC1_9GAMM|nr:hypothetical protein Lmor_2325 [Legionella moravica]STX62482.1 Uncharacterised protein [Legionella moravica]
MLRFDLKDPASVDISAISPRFQRFMSEPSSIYEVRPWPIAVRLTGAMINRP